MAIRDVREYYYTMLNQYIQSKEDLADFETAFKDGYITEDRLESVKEDVDRLKENVDRITYIMYLFEMPNRKSKQARYKKTNKDLAEYFKENNADAEALRVENNSTLTHLRNELKTLTSSAAEKSTKKKRKAKQAENRRVGE